MSEWETVKLGELCKIVAGSAAPAENLFDKGNGLPFIRAGHLEQLCNGFEQNDLPTISTEYAKLIHVPNNTILFAKSGMSCLKNRVYLTTNEAYIVSHLAGVICSSSRIYSIYLKYFLIHFTPSKLSQDSSYPSIRLADVESIQIPLPPLEIQEKIACTLDKVSELLALRKRQLEELDVLIQAIFYEMFGDPRKNLVLGDIKKMGEIFQITSGGTPSKSNNEFYENGTIYWVKTGDLKEKYLFEVPDKITEKALENSSAKLFPINTVLVAMYGATIGACSILKTNAATNQACAAFLPSDLILPSYLYHYFENQKQNLIKMGVGGAQPNISGTLLKNLSIVVPPLEIQEKFV